MDSVSLQDSAELCGVEMPLMGFFFFSHHSRFLKLFIHTCTPKTLAGFALRSQPRALGGWQDSGVPPHSSLATAGSTP